MEIILKRQLSNRSCTQGTLQIGNEEICTLEGRMPRDGKSNIGWLLPQGKYTLDVVYAPIQVKGMILHCYWTVSQRVPWYPKAMFLSQKMRVVNKGMIAIGTAAPDEFSIDDEDGATQKLARFCTQYHKTNGNEPLTLNIIEDHDTMTFNDYTREEYEAVMADERIREAQEAFERSLKDFNDYE